MRNLFDYFHNHVTLIASHHERYFIKGVTEGTGFAIKIGTLVTHSNFFPRRFSL